MAGRHIDRLEVAETIGDWLICKERGWIEPMMIRHNHEKSELTWNTELIEPGVAVCEICAEPVPPGVRFIFRTWKLRKAVEE